jgi:hypothetical protein
MPTYYNGSQRVYTDPDNNFSIEIGETKAVYEYITATGLTKTSDLPYWNPITDQTLVTFSGAEALTVNLDVSNQKNYVLIWQVTTCNVDIYLQSVDNTPKWATLRPGDSIVIPVHNRANRLALISSAAGSCYILQSTEELEV